MIQCRILDECIGDGVQGDDLFLRVSKEVFDEYVNLKHLPFTLGIHVKINSCNY